MSERDASGPAEPLRITHTSVARTSRRAQIRAGSSLSKILVCPADDTRSVASIKTSMPPFTEATTTLCARALGLDATSEYVFAHPAIYPFTLFNQAFSALGTLGGMGRV